MSPLRKIGYASALVVLTFTLGGQELLADGNQSVPFTEAVSHGVVDVVYSKYNKRSIEPVVDHIGELDPGIVNRFGFAFGGPDLADLERQATILRRMRALLPRALMGAVFPQDLSKGYAVSLKCGGNERTFLATTMMSAAPLPPELARDFVMLDMSKSELQDYEICLGKIYVDQGFSFMHFEQLWSVVIRSESQPAAMAGYHRIQNEVRDYAATFGRRIYFSGDWLSATELHLEAVYEPSRFYHTTVPAYLKYQNRVPRPGIGVGYTYTFSPQIITESVARVPPYTLVMFYVDNWNPAQDDLRRMMELDGQNRRTLLIKSAENAAKGGAYFIPTIFHCPCGPDKEEVGDSCEDASGGGPTQYDGYMCGDWPTIHQALLVQSQGHK